MEGQSAQSENAVIKFNDKREIHAWRFSKACIFYATSLEKVSVVSESLGENQESFNYN